MMRALAVMMVVAVVVAGCQSADPASRSNRTQYRDLYVHVQGSSNAVHMTVGDGLYASADARDSTDDTHSSPVQTTDTRPEVAVALQGGSAGTGGAQPSSGIVGQALEKLMAWVGGDSSVKLSAAEAAAVQAACTNCTESTPE